MTVKLLEKVLIATDFSPGADDALDAGVQVARQFGSEVTVIHVIPGNVEFCSQHRTVVRKRAKERLEGIAIRMRVEGVGNVDTVVEDGVPFDQIDRMADASGANVIFIGACKKSEDGSVPVGTTAARLLRNATRPVWMVKPRAPARVTKVLCPVDYSQASGRALKNAIHLARTFHAELTVLTVIPTSSAYDEGFSDVDVGAQDTSSQLPPSPFARFLGKHDFHDVSWKRTVRHGDPGREILKLASEEKADLLVMGSVGKTDFARILIGGVARKVTQQMPCSIITVKSEHAIKLRLDVEIADIQARLKQGLELLERGFAQEAMAEFQQCISKDMLLVPAWEGLAAAHQRLGHPGEAKECREQARQITRTLWDSQIDDDIGSQQALFGRNRR